MALCLSLAAQCTVQTIPFVCGELLPDAASAMVVLHALHQLRSRRIRCGDLQTPDTGDLADEVFIGQEGTA